MSKESNRSVNGPADGNSWTNLNDIPGWRLQHPVTSGIGDVGEEPPGVMLAGPVFTSGSQVCLD